MTYKNSACNSSPEHTTPESILITKGYTCIPITRSSRPSKKERKFQRGNDYELPLLPLKKGCSSLMHTHDFNVWAKEDLSVFICMYVDDEKAV